MGGADSAIEQQVLERKREVLAQRFEALSLSPAC